MNNQLAALIEAENEVAVNIESYLKKKKGELNQNLQQFYRKKNYEFILQKTNELKGHLEKKKLNMENIKAKVVKLQAMREDRKTEYAIHLVQQKMKLNAMKKQMEELQKVVKVKLHALEKQATEYNMQLVNDIKRVGYLSEKLNGGISTLKLSQQILGEKFKSVCDVVLPEEQAEYNPRDSQAEPLSEMEKPKEGESEQPQDKESVNPEEQANPSDKHSILANPSESSSAPKFGCINVNLADLNVTGSEAEKGTMQLDSGFEEIKGRIEEKTENYAYSSFNEKTSKYKVKLSSCTIKEIQLYDSVKFVLEGVQIYKKYGAENTLKSKIFDPLIAQKCPPETCGFGKRLVIYNPTTNKLEFRLLDKLYVIEHMFSLTEIKKVVVQNETKQIVKIQKSNSNLSETFRDSSLMKIDKLDRNADNETYREQCKLVRFYPFSLLTKDKRIELISETYTVFKCTISAFNQMLENQSLLKGFNQKLISNEPPKEKEKEKENGEGKGEIEPTRELENEGKTQ